MMAYSPNGLSALSYANGFTLWHYKTPDMLGSICETGHFNAAASMLRAGDFIMVNANVGRTVDSAVLIVKSSTGSIVDVSNIADLGAP